MGKRVNMANFNMMDDLVELLYSNEIQYLTEEEDIPSKVNYRDIFKVGGKYYMYIVDSNQVSGFAELSLTPEDKTTTEKATQEEAIEYLKSLL